MLDTYEIAQVKAIVEGIKDKYRPEFITSGYSTPSWMGDIKQYGLNSTGLTYGDGSDEINTAIEYDLPIIYPIRPLALAGEPVAGGDVIIQASDATVEEWIASAEQVVESVVNNPLLNQRVCMWYLLPEELRWWKQEEKELGISLYDAIKDADPEKRPIINYQPKHSDFLRLVSSSEWTDILCQGVYPYLNGGDIAEYIGRVSKDLQDASEATGKPHIPVLEMYQDSSPLSVDSYVRLLVKGTDNPSRCGIFVFSMAERSGFTQHQDYLDAYSKYLKQELETFS
jgi:hypothetical protein